MLRKPVFYLALVMTASSMSQIARADNLLVGIGESDGSVREYKPSGVLVGNFVAQGNGLNDPWNMTFGPDGNLYVASDIGGDIREFNGTTGSYIRTVASGFSNPVDVKFDSGGALYVAEAGANRITKLNPLTGLTLHTYTSGLNGVYSLVFTPGGELLATNYYSNDIVEIDPVTGTFSTFATGFSHPSGITLGPDGRYYIADSGGSIDVVNAIGGSASAWSSGQSLSLGATFMTFDAGNLFVSVIGGVDYFDATTGSYQGNFSTGVNNTTGLIVRPAATPEPGTLALLASLGLTGAAFLRRRRR